MVGRFYLSCTELDMLLMGFEMLKLKEKTEITVGSGIHKEIPYSLEGTTGEMPTYGGFIKNKT